MIEKTAKSRYNLYLIGCLTVIFVGCLTNIINFDIWWHLAGGKYNLTHGVILDKDVFSYTFKGYEWLNFEWLFEMLFFLLYILGEAPLAIISKALIITASYFVLFKSIEIGEKSKPALWVFILVLILYLGSRPRFLVRPQIFMFFFLISYYYILLLYREGNRNFLFVLIALQLPWSGLHSSPFYGQMLVGFFLFETVVRYFRDRHDQVLAARLLHQIRNLTLCLATLFLTLLINPYHYLIYVFPFRAMDVIHEVNLIGEWFPPTPQQSFPYHYLGAIVAIGCVYPLFKKRRYAEVLFLLFLGISSFRYIRLIGIFLFILTPIAVREIKDLIPDRLTLADRLRAKWLVPAVVILGMTGLVTWNFSHSFIRLGLKTQPQRYPEAAIEFIQKNIPQKRGLTIYNWGGYFMWHLYPDQETFIDGRGMPFEDIFKEYYYLFRSPLNFQSVLEKYNIDYLYFDSLSPQANKLDQKFLPPDKWSLIYWDSVGALYLKNVAANHSLINRFAYRFLRPFFPSNSYIQKINRQNYAALNIEITTAIKTDPQNAAAYLKRAYLATITNNFDQAVNDYLKTIELNPRHATAHFNLGQLYRHLDQPQKAGSEYRKALNLNPGYQLPYVYLGLILIKAGKLDEATALLRDAVKLNNNSVMANFSLGLALYLSKTERADYYLGIAKNKIQTASYKERSEITDLAATYRVPFF